MIMKFAGSSTLANELTVKSTRLRGNAYKMLGGKYLGESRLEDRGEDGSKTLGRILGKIVCVIER
jgi:hypothetical protein